MSDSFCCSRRVTHGLQVVPKLSKALRFSKLPYCRQGFHPSASTAHCMKSKGGFASSGGCCIRAARLMRPIWVPAPRRAAPRTQRLGLRGWDFGTSGSPGCVTSGKLRVCHPKWDSAGLGFDSLSAAFQGKVWEGSRLL